MQVPLQVTFHNVDHSSSLEDRIREKFQKLEKLYDQITSCRVVVERPHHAHSQGDLFDVRIDMAVPGHEFIVKSEKGNHADADVYIALRNAFEALQRQIKEFNDRNRRAQRVRRAAAE
ncbi:MAG: ribosome hibernation-promoting factor, HPF/YfiA family [Magnetospiraceae bacterium]